MVDDNNTVMAFNKGIYDRLSEDKREAYLTSCFGDDADAKAAAIMVEAA